MIKIMLKKELLLDVGGGSVYDEDWDALTPIIEGTINWLETDIETIHPWVLQYCSNLFIFHANNLTGFISSNTNSNRLFNYSGVLEFNANGYTLASWSSTPSPLFNNCSNLTTVRDIGQITYYDSNFQYCHNLTSAKLSNAITLDGTFYNCEKLVETNCSFPNVTTITNSAFNSCDSLTSLNVSWLPKVKELGSYAFAYCSKLSSINLPNVEKLTGQRVFSLYKNKTITLKRCNYIHKTAFAGTTGVTLILNANYQSTIESLEGFSTNFGGTNLTIQYY